MLSEVKQPQKSIKGPSHDECPRTWDFPSKTRLLRVQGIGTELNKPLSPDIQLCATSKGKREKPNKQEEQQQRLRWQEKQACRFPTRRDLSERGRDNCYNLLVATAQLWLLGAPKLKVGGRTLKCSFLIYSKSSTCLVVNLTTCQDRALGPLVLSQESEGQRSLPEAMHSGVQVALPSRQQALLKILAFYTLQKNNPSGFLFQASGIFDGAG